MHAVTQAGEAWDYPQPFDNVIPTTCAGCVRKVRHQKYRYDPRSPDWVVLALAKHLGLDPRADRKKLNAVLRAWYANSVLAAEIQRRGCATSGNTWFPEIGTMIPMPPDSTASVAMRERAPEWQPFTGA
jgi:hypothetical protein